MNGRPVRLLSARDITRQKMLEEQLLQAQKLDALGKVTGEVAHDFNNLLAVMMASVENLLDTLPADHEGQSAGATALRAAEQAATLTRRLLAFARQQDLAPQLVEPTKVVPQLEAILRSAVSTIELVFDIDRATPCCVVDRGQLETALLNLVVNARDATTAQGRITIMVGQSHIDAEAASRDPALREGQWVSITVADTGCGMAEDVRRRLFEPFFTTKAPGKGTGLGLSQVHGFVLQSQGFVTVESAPGQGTRIAMHFPVAA
jgi:signal transduction histidine kinase